MSFRTLLATLIVGSLLFSNVALAAEAAKMAPPPWASKDKQELVNKREANILLINSKKILPGSFAWLTISVPVKRIDDNDYEYVSLRGLTKFKVLSVSQEVQPLVGNDEYYELGLITVALQDTNNIKYILTEKDADEIVRELSTQNLETKYKKWGKRVINAIQEGKVVIGMTKQQVLMSWGEATKINRTIGKWGTHEQWVYRENGPPFLYLENGKLTSYQD